MSNIWNCELSSASNSINYREHSDQFDSELNFDESFPCSFQSSMTEFSQTSVAVNSSVGLKYEQNIDAFFSPVFSNPATQLHDPKQSLAYVYRTSTPKNIPKTCQVSHQIDGEFTSNVSYYSNCNKENCSMQMKHHSQQLKPILTQSNLRNNVQSRITSMDHTSMFVPVVQAQIPCHYLQNFQLPSSGCPSYSSVQYVNVGQKLKSNALCLFPGEIATGSLHKSVR